MSSATNQSITTYQPNGVTQVSLGQGNSAPDVPDVDSLHGNLGSGRLTVHHDGTQTTESFNVSKANMGQDMLDRREQAQSILETARAPHGGRAGKLSPDSVVNVGGMETTLAVAEQLGYVMRQSNGDYVETSHSPFRAAQPSGGQATNDATNASAGDSTGDSAGDTLEVPKDILDGINGAVAELPQHVFEGTLHKAINFGTDSLDYKALADHFGSTEADARARVAFVAQAYQVHAGQALKGTVADPQEALAWLAESKPKEFASAMTKLVFGNSTAELKALAKQFMLSTNPDDDSLKQAGFEVRTERNGTRMVRVQGVWMALSSAVKAGYV